MRFLIFFILFFQLYRTSTSPTNAFQTGETATTVPTSIQNDDIGYECGNVFFTKNEVQEVLWRVNEYARLESRTFQIYRGPLYSDSLSSEYLLWPIKKGARVLSNIKYNTGAFFIVFKKNGPLIDVITRIINNDYTKCIKRDGSPMKPSVSNSERTNGYQCGYKFLSGQIIQEATTLAKNSMGLVNKYPTPYVGSLYPEASGYMIWPVLYGKRLYESGPEAGPYFIVLNKKGELIDIIVRGYLKNFLRCIRTRKISSAPISDSYSKLFVPPPRAGFQCGRIFFDKKVLEQTAVEAQSIIFHQKRKRYPIEYNGHPFNQKCWLWPLLNNGKLYRKGMIGPYRVVLTPDYKVLGAAIILEEGKLEACESKTMTAKKNHDTNSYYCSENTYTPQRLVKAAEEACERMNNDRRKLYPARYEGPRFEKDGPYFTHPVFPHRSFKMVVGPDRVVINTECEVVGALTTVEINQEKKLVKCPVSKFSMPMSFLYNPNESISEHRTRY